MEDFYSRFIGDGAVAVGSGTATLVAASGLTESVAYNGVGDVTVTLREPGLAKVGVQDPDVGDLNVPVLFIQMGSGSRGFVQYSIPTLQTIRVLTFDATNTPADISFQFLLKSTQRRLVP